MSGRTEKARHHALPEKISFDDQDITRVVLEHLRERGYIAAMRALEKESGVQAVSVGEDASFLRSLVLDGRWEDAASLIEPLRPGTVVHGRACFELRKQEFLELLESKKPEKSAAVLVKALHRLEPASSREEFDDLCHCLTLPGLRSHPAYTQWTPHLGRLWCIEALQGYMETIFKGLEKPAEVVPEGQLYLLCEQACRYQAEEHQRLHPDATFPRTAVAGLLSGAWAPKPALSRAKHTAETKDIDNDDSATGTGNSGHSGDRVDRDVPRFGDVGDGFDGGNRGQAKRRSAGNAAGRVQATPVSDPPVMVSLSGQVAPRTGNGADDAAAAAVCEDDDETEGVNGRARMSKHDRMEWVVSCVRGGKQGGAGGDGDVGDGGDGSNRTAGVERRPESPEVVQHQYPSPSERSIPIHLTVEDGNATPSRGEREMYWEERTRESEGAGSSVQVRAVGVGHDDAVIDHHHQRPRQQPQKLRQQFLEGGLRALQGSVAPAGDDTDSRVQPALSPGVASDTATVATTVKYTDAAREASRDGYGAHHCARRGNGEMTAAIGAIGMKGGMCDEIGNGGFAGDVTKGTGPIRAGGALHPSRKSANMVGGSAAMLAAIAGGVPLVSSGGPAGNAAGAGGGDGSLRAKSNGNLSDGGGGRPRRGSEDEEWWRRRSHGDGSRQTARRVNNKPDPPWAVRSGRDENGGEGGGGRDAAATLGRRGDRQPVNGQTGAEYRSDSDGSVSDKRGTSSRDGGRGSGDGGDDPTETKDEHYAYLLAFGPKESAASAEGQPQVRQRRRRPDMPPPGPYRRTEPRRGADDMIHGRSSENDDAVDAPVVMRVRSDESLQKTPVAWELKRTPAFEGASLETPRDKVMRGIHAELRSDMNGDSDGTLAHTDGGGGGGGADGGKASTRGNSPGCREADWSVPTVTQRRAISRERRGWTVDGGGGDGDGDGGGGGDGRAARAVERNSRGRSRHDKGGGRDSRGREAPSGGSGDGRRPPPGRLVVVPVASSTSSMAALSPPSSPSASPATVTPEAKAHELVGGAVADTHDARGQDRDDSELILPRLEAPTLGGAAIDSSGSVRDVDGTKSDALDDHSVKGHRVDGGNDAEQVGGDGDSHGGDDREVGQRKTREAPDFHGYDELSREEAPSFYPTIVMRGSHPVRTVAFSPDGGLFAVGSNDRTLKVCRSPTEADLSSANYEANVDERSGLRVWQSAEILRRANYHRGSIYCLAFSPNSSLIATGSNDKMVRVLPLPEGGMMINGHPDRKASSSRVAKNDSNRSGSSLTGDYDHDNGFGSNETGSAQRGGSATEDRQEEASPCAAAVVLRGHNGTIRDICFPSPHPGGSITPSTSSYAALYGHNAHGNEEASSRLLLSVGAGDFACRIWDLEGGPVGGEGGARDGEVGLEPLIMFRGHTNTVFSCSMLPGGNVAVTGGADAVVRVWDTRTGGSIRSLIVEEREVLCVRTWPGDPERVMATSHSDGSCFLWDMRTGRALSSVFHHNDQIRSLDFSPNGHALLTASYDGLIGVSQCRAEGGGRGGNTGHQGTRGFASPGFIAAGASEPTLPPPQSPSDQMLENATAVRRKLVGDSSRNEPHSGGVSMSGLAMLRAHGGRVLQARWRPTGRPAFLTSSTDCAVMLWSLPEARL